MDGNPYGQHVDLFQRPRYPLEMNCINPQKAWETRSLSQSRKMQIWLSRSRLPRINCQTKLPRNGPYQIKRNSWLACPFYSETGQVIPRIWKLLQEIDWKICWIGSTSKWSNWTPKWQKAFDMLKKKFEEAPVLLMPNPIKPFVIESNTSKFATGAVLWQQNDNGD